jgi:6-pyruvoyltetrahydropterin/6-carboxytetrahydropterin synthase
MLYQITRTIEIDAGHRVPDHQSKCQHIHGHRFKIELGISAEKLRASGPESGMITDFGIMKQVLMSSVHSTCDHRLMLYIEDPLLQYFIHSDRYNRFKDLFEQSPSYIKTAATKLSPTIELVVCSFIPTAENLAEAWYKDMSPGIEKAIGQPPDYVCVWETPNSTAKYEP